MLLALAAAGLLLPFTTRIEASHPEALPVGEFVAGAVLVKFKPLIPSFMADATLSIQGLRMNGNVVGSEVRKAAVAPGEELRAVAALRGNPLVDYAEPDYVLQTLWVPNDAYYSTAQWNLRQINVEKAWDITRGSPGVKVAVIDTGLNMYNPDRPANIVSPRNQCTSGSEMGDSNNHGTHVSGIIAASANNGIGISGVAPDISLMPVKVECDGIITTSATTAAVHHAVDNGARVMNISLGTASFSQTMSDAIAYAVARGTLVVAAAGNGYSSGNLPMYPAAFPGVLAVGASTHEQTRASYSEVQPYVSVVAPGGDPSGGTDPDPNHWIKSTYGTSYGSLAGTSQAAPHASGLAGLIWSVNPGLNSAQVADIITSTASDLGPPGRDNEFGWGQVDAYPALLKAKGLSASPSPTPAVQRTSPSRIYVPLLPRDNSNW